MKRLHCPQPLSQPMRVKWLSGHLGNHFCAASSSFNLAAKWLHLSVQHAETFLSKTTTLSLRNPETYPCSCLNSEQFLLRVLNLLSFLLFTLLLQISSQEKHCSRFQPTEPSRVFVLMSVSVRLCVRVFFRYKGSH